MKKDTKSGKLYHSHDGMAKAFLSDNEVAREIISLHLPPFIVEEIRWDTLHLPNKSYVDKKLRQYHADMVYGFKIGEQDAYASIEHLSAPNLLLPFFQLVYNFLLMDQCVKATKKARKGNNRPPLVFNLCIYAGLASPYPYSFDIYDCFDNPELARQVLFKPTSSLDLTTISEKDLLARYKKCHIYLLLLKQAPYKKFIEWVETHPQEMAKLYNSRYGEEGIAYILNNEDEKRLDELVKTLSSIVPNKQKLVMSAANKLRQEGRQEGRLEERLTIARSMLVKLHLDVDTVQKATELPKNQLEKILLETNGSVHET